MKKVSAVLFALMLALSISASGCSDDEDSKSACDEVAEKMASTLDAACADYPECSECANPSCTEDEAEACLADEAACKASIEMGVPILCEAEQAAAAQ